MVPPLGCAPTLRSSSFDRPGTSVPDLDACAGCVSEMGEMFFEYPTGTATPVDAGVFLAGCDTDAWETVLEHCEVRRLRRGEVVIAAGDEERSLLIVTDGELEAVRRRRRRTRTVGHFGPGSVVGEMSFLDGEARSADVVAITDAEVLRLTFEAFESLSARHPSLARAMLIDLGRIVVGRLRALNRELDLQL